MQFLTAVQSRQYTIKLQGLVYNLQYFRSHWYIRCDVTYLLLHFSTSIKLTCKSAVLDGDKRFSVLSHLLEKV